MKNDISITTNAIEYFSLDVPFVIDRFNKAIDINQRFPFEGNPFDWGNINTGNTEGQLYCMDINSDLRANVFKDEVSKIIIYQTKSASDLPEVIVRLHKRREDGLIEFKYGYDPTSSTVNEVICKFRIGLSNKPVFVRISLQFDKLMVENETAPITDKWGKKIDGLDFDKLRNSKRTHLMAGIANKVHSIVFGDNYIFLDK